MGKRFVFVVLTLAACDAGTEATPDPTSNQGGASPTSAAATGTTTSTATAVTSTGTTMVGEETNGTRLAVRYAVGEDGSRVRLGIFDGQLGVMCDYRLASDGVTRCLPMGTTERHEDIEFFNMDCTNERAVVTSCGTSQQYITVKTASCSRFSVFQVGAPVQTVTRRVSGGECDPYSLELGESAFLLGPEVPPANFVAGSLQ